MAGNRVTEGMKTRRKEFFHMLRTNFGRYKIARASNQEQARRRASHFGHSRSVKYGDILSPRRRSWKGPTRWYPRCKAGHPVEKDMARCFVCIPKRPKASYV